MIPPKVIEFDPTDPVDMRDEWWTAAWNEMRMRAQKVAQQDDGKDGWVEGDLDG